MKRASQWFSAEQRAKVAATVAEGEARTSAEIVPVVATESGRYDRPEDLVGLGTALVAVAAVWALWPREALDPGSWGGPPALFELAALGGAILVGFVAGAAIAGRVGWLRQLVTPRAQMREEVERRSRQVFHDGRVHHTAGRSGVLLYVSLFERMAAVVADQATTEALGPDTLEALCARLTEELRRGDVAEALCVSIRETAGRLAPVLPRKDDDVNELSDALVLLD